MKKSIILAVAAICFTLSNAKAQNVNGVKLSDIHSDYIEITDVKATFSDKRWMPKKTSNLFNCWF